jgi:hypothetical protein
LFVCPDQGLILGLMAKDVSKLTFDPKPLTSGTGWYVVATYRAVIRNISAALRPRPKPSNGSPAAAVRLGLKRGATR